MGGKANTNYGWIEGSKPMVFVNPDKKTTGERCLNTADIIGAQPDTKTKGPFTWMDRRDVRLINRVDDIAGCGPDTIRRAPNTKRNLNPLIPEYVVPGCAEAPVNDLNDPYGEKVSSMGA